MFYSKTNLQTPRILFSRKFTVLYRQQKEGNLKFELLIWFHFQKIWFMGRFAREMIWKITKNSWIFYFHSSFFAQSRCVFIMKKSTFEQIRTCPKFSKKLPKSLFLWDLKIIRRYLKEQEFLFARRCIIFYFQVTE